MKELEKRRIWNRVHLLDRTAVDGRAEWMMLWHLDVYQAVRSLSRVFAKVGDVPSRERPCFPVGDIAIVSLKFRLTTNGRTLHCRSLVRAAPRCAGIGK
jgi:hypothetical protein